MIEIYKPTHELYDIKAKGFIAMKELTYKQYNLRGHNMQIHHKLNTTKSSPKTWNSIPHEIVNFR